MHEHLKMAYELSEKGEPFAIATVVWSERPTSAKPGAKAIIRADGTLSGWVGGSCAQPVVVKEALKAFRDGKPRLVSLNAQGMDGEEEGREAYPMTCQSGGLLEIYVEPVLPQPELVILGRTPVARTLAHLGTLLDFAVCVAAPTATREEFPEADTLLNELEAVQAKIRPESYVVVATMGDADEESLEAAVRSKAGYIGLVASRKKAEGLFQYLRVKGILPERLQRVKCPAGLDLGAVSPPEIAFSIMAEIIQLRRRGVGRGIEEVEAAPVPGAIDVSGAAEATDPICGMTVETATTRYTSTYHGKTFHFCCLRCQETFDRDPEKYATSARGER